MITIQQAPSVESPVYNDITYVLSSSNVAQTNFKYVVDIYTLSTLRARLLIPPHPTHLTGLVNVAPILEGYISREVDTDISDDTVVNCPGHYVSYEVKFGESYGSSGTIFADLTTSTGVAWNSIFDYEDFCSYSSGDYEASSVTPSQFLTNKPSSGDIMTDDNAWLYWIHFNNPSAHRTFRVKTYDSSGALIANRRIAGSVAAIIRRIPTGANNINNIDNGNIISGGNQPIITASVAKYSIQMFTNDGVTPLTEEYWYTITSDCSIYTKHRIQFLNKLGGYDFFNFTLASKSTSEIERQTYKKNLGSYASANSFVYSPSDRAHTNHYTRIKDKFTITSDWVSEEVYEWLYELITSPDAYLDNGTDLIPINITNSTYESRKTVTNKLFNLTLEYTLSYDRYRQRL